VIDQNVLLTAILIGVAFVAIELLVICRRLSSLIEKLFPEEEDQPAARPASVENGEEIAAAVAAVAALTNIARK
jgi:Na+-transporting methylmalonyl-CoA/oxaloacetate decarboxylase gamma subunit